MTPIESTVEDPRTAEELRTASVLLDRALFMRQAGITFDGSRDMYAILGYDRVVTAKQYRDEYARGGLAKRIVECYPKATWRGGVNLYEDENVKDLTVFEQAWEDLVKRLDIWTKLQCVDILAGLSTYAVLLIGVAGTEGFETELPRGMPEKLLYLTPFSGGGGPGFNQGVMSGASNYVDANIQEFETDARSPRFGQPKFYTLRRLNVSSPDLQKPVHWSRIVHVAEGCLDNEVYGQPTLENVWNLLIDLQKVTGGGAEAFWLRANAGLQIDIDKKMQLAPTEDERVKLKEQVDEYIHNLTRVIRTRGVNINQLGSDVADFGSPADAIIKQIAGSKGIPMRILTGSEMGELASTQDADNWETAVMDRRTSYAGPAIVRRLVDRLIVYGYLPTPKQYEVSWPVEEGMNETEKASFAVQLATVNKTQGETVFTDAEIRDMTFDMEPLTPAQKKEIADRAAEKLQQAQEAMAAAAPPAGNGADAGGTAPKKRAFPRAAELAATLRALEAAVESENLVAIGRLLDLEPSKGLTAQEAINLLSEGLGADGFVTAKRYVASLGAELSTLSIESLRASFAEYFKRYGTGFDGRGHQVERS